LTLTVDLGVAVRFNQNTRLVAQSGGTISAVAAPLNRITFTSVAVATPGSGVALTGGLGTFTSCDFTSLVYGIQLGCCGGNPGTVNDCTFQANTYGIQGY